MKHHWIGSVEVMDKMLLIPLLLLTVQTGVRGDLAGYSGVSGGYQQNSVALTGSLSRSGDATHVSWSSKAKVV